MTSGPGNYHSSHSLVRLTARILYFRLRGLTSFLSSKTQYSTASCFHWMLNSHIIYIKVKVSVCDHYHFRQCVATSTSVSVLISAFILQDAQIIYNMKTMIIARINFAKCTFNNWCSHLRVKDGNSLSMIILMS